MSMFYELMMRKKEQIMYATIKGTLTENDGVFSGFSASNYLKLQQPFSSNENWIISLKLKTSNVANTSTEYIFGSTNGSDRSILLGYGGGLFKLWLSSNGTAWDIVSGIGTYTLQANTDYYVRLSYINSAYKFEISTDNINWVDGGTISSTTPIYNNSILYFGACWDKSTNYMKGDGNFDLNNSYIKIGSTKYNLQAVVGYTVVGSPTIVDGVVSGFSSGNYLYLPSAPSWSNIDILETFTTFTTSTMNTLQIVMGSRYSQATCCVEITSANKPLFRITYSDSGGTTKYKETTINYVLSANTKYKVKNYFNKQTLVIKSELYDENGIMLASASSSLASDYTSIANINDFWYGYNPQRGTFSGSIDFNNNNTYIKINNKLWFNGQQA